MDLRLDRRVVLVAGGTGFIGSAIVERLDSEGATTVVASRRGTADVTLDVGDGESVAAGIARVLHEHGRLDAVVVSAAAAASSLDQARNSDPAQIAEAVDSKALGFLRVASAAMPAMIGSGFGRIVGISGQNAFLTGNIAGSVRNSALNVIAKNLADSAASTGVTVNIVNPGHVDLAPSPTPEQGKGGDCSPVEIADLVAFLVSPLSALSGESISIGHNVRGFIR